MKSENVPLTADDQERQNFLLFAERVRDHYNNEQCQRRMYPENVSRYQQNIDFWKARLKTSGLDKDPTIQRIAFETEWLIADMLLGIIGPDARTSVIEPTDRSVA